MSNALFTLTIPGVAVAKGRPRATTVGGHARLYTPAKTRAWEAQIYALAVAQGIKPVERGVAVEVDVLVFWPCPSGAPARVRRAVESGDESVPVVTKPDATNIVKAVEDALNGVAWADDSQIAALHVWKNYSREPRVVVTARVMEG